MTAPRDAQREGGSGAGAREGGGGGSGGRAGAVTRADALTRRCCAEDFLAGMQDSVDSVELQANLRPADIPMDAAQKTARTRTSPHREGAALAAGRGFGLWARTAHSADLLCI